MVAEESAAVQVENEDGDEEDEDEGSAEQEDDGQETGLVGGKLLQLNVLQAVGEVLRGAIRVFRMIWVFHTGLDAPLRVNSN